MIKTRAGRKCYVKESQEIKGKNILEQNNISKAAFEKKIVSY